MFKKNTLLLVSTVIVVFLGLFIFIYTNGEKDIPKLDVIYNGNKIEIGQSYYKWKSNFKEKIHKVDSNADVISKLLPGVRVAPGSKLELNFDYQPKSITVNGGYSQDNAPTLENNIINIPKGEGTQLYFLDCEWKEGTVTYIIAIDIQK